MAGLALAFDPGEIFLHAGGALVEFLEAVEVADYRLISNAARRNSPFDLVEAPYGGIFRRRVRRKILQNELGDDVMSFRSGHRTNPYSRNASARNAGGVPHGKLRHPA